MPEGLMLLFFLSCPRLDVNNLETTCGIEKHHNRTDGGHRGTYGAKT
jgi:hypothetical protein